MMTGNGVMHNGTTIIDEYGVNLDKLKVANIMNIFSSALTLEPVDQQFQPGLIFVSKARWLPLEGNVVRCPIL